MAKSVKELAGINIHKDTLTIKHADIKRINGSIFKGECPVCEMGYLLVQRNQKTFELSDVDRCILCGQKFKYSDIDKLKKKAGEK